MEVDKEKRRSRYIFITAAIVFCSICFFIFYKQVTSSTGYPSDIPTHIGFITNEGGDASAGYSLLHSLIKGLVFIFDFLNLHVTSIRSILMILILVASQLISLIIIHEYFKKRYNANPNIILFFSLSMMVVSMIIINPFSPPFYIGTGTPNPWHTPTFIFCKPFSILAFLLVVNASEHFNERRNLINVLILLLLFSVLSMWAKPSFMMSFLPSVAIIFINKYLQKEISFKFLVLVALSMLPSILPFYIIYNKVFNSLNSAESVIISVGQVWSSHSKNIPLSIILAMAFPLYVFIIKIKHLSTSHLLAFTNYIIAMMIYFILAEKGFRTNHANFSWGYMFAMFLLFLVSIDEFFLKKKTLPLYYKIGWGLFILHLFSGLYYLSNIALGHSYF